MSSHESKMRKARFIKVLQLQPIGNSFEFFDKLCGSSAGVTSHMSVHGGNINRKDS